MEHPEKLDAPEAFDENPNPVEWDKPKYNEVEDHRLLGCLNYDECLTLAGKLNWRGWSCCQCGVFQASRSLPEQDASEILINEKRAHNPDTAH